jgi:hypothetical protein
MCQEHRSSCARLDGDTERSAKSTGYFDLSTHLPNWVVGQSAEAVLGQLHWEANGGWQSQRQVGCPPDVG